jgi:pimeloyl-ACP methyl ester carboxylesterase
VISYAQKPQATAIAEPDMRSEEMYQARIKGRSVRHRVRDIDYHVTEWGERHGRLLVFLHGWGDAGSTFQFVIDELQQDWFVIAPDWRGFGETRGDAESYWFPDYLADLDEILRIYSPDAAVRLVGHSMGANAAAMYAGAMPERVVALVNVEGFGLPDGDPASAPLHYRKWIKAVRTRPTRTSYESLDELLPKILRRSPGLTREKALFVADKWAEARSNGVVRIKADPAHKLPNAVLYRREEAIACWRNVTAPVLVVVGAETDHTSALAAWTEPDTADAAFRHSTTETIEGAGHMVHFDQPAALAASIEGFLENPGSDL